MTTAIVERCRFMQQVAFEKKSRLKRIRTVGLTIGERIRRLIQSAVTELVENEEDLSVELIDTGETELLLFKVKVKQEQMGRAIGKSWKNVQALRTLTEAMAAKHNKRVYIEMLSDDVNYLKRGRG